MLHALMYLEAKSVPIIFIKVHYSPMEVDIKMLDEQVSMAFSQALLPDFGL
jgi:hypothetical protein